MPSVRPALLCLLCLAGCSAVLTSTFRTRMEASLASYQACLAEHESDPSACAAEKRSYDTDRQRYSNILTQPTDGGGGGGGM
jgi:hypothetical protein